MTIGMNATGSFGANAPSATGKIGMQKKGGYNFFERPQFTPEQMQLFQSLFGQLGPDSFLGKLAGGDQSTFAQLEAPALNQFNQLQGQLGSRFSGMGMGGRRSSGFQNASGQASSDFAQQLQSQRLGLQRQAIQDLMGMSNQLLSQRPYESFIAPKKRSFLEELLAGISPGLSQGFGQAMGNKWFNPSS
jgi:hypothetical protein